MVDRWPFVGRESELARIATAIRDPAVSGIVLAGEAGVGKSKLAHQATVGLDSDRYVVKTVTSTTAAATIPFGALAALLPVPPDGQLNVLRWAADQLTADVGDRQLVLLVDDAHMLDNASAALVLVLASTSAAFVLVTVRAAEQSPDAIAALWKDSLTDRLEIGALDQSTTHDLLTRALGGSVDDVTSQQLWRMSGGNALWLREIILAGWHIGPPALTPRLVELVATRIGHVSRQARHVLEAAAFGEPLGLALALRFGDAEAVNEVEAKQLITVSSSGRRTEVRLAHPLYGEVIRSTCTTLQARHLQQRLAELVEATGARRQSDLLRVALWRLESGTANDAGMFLAAGHRAWIVLDLPLAQRFATAALSAGGGVPAAILLGSVLNGAEHYEQAETVLKAAASLPMTEQQRTEFTVARGHNLFFGLQQYDETMRLLVDSLNRMHTPVARQQIRVCMAALQFWHDDAAGAVRVTDELNAEEVPAHLDLLIHTVLAVSHAHLGQGEKAHVSAAQADQIITSGGTATPFLQHTLDIARCHAWLFTGNLTALEQHASVMHQRAGLAVQWDIELVLSSLWLGQAARLRGRLDQADRWCRTGADHVRARRTMFLSSYLTELAHVAALRGDVDTAESLLDEAERARSTALRPFQLWTDIARTWVLAAAGCHSVAVDNSQSVAKRARVAGYLGLEVFALHDVVRLGRAAAVVDRLTALASEVDGELATLCARHARARDGAELEAVASGFEQQGMILHAAEAAAQASANYRMDSSRLAKRAELRASALAGRCHGARTPALAALTLPGLTSRELEIARIAATGLSSADIGVRLAISQRTVDNHLQRVYRKLGITSRTELASSLIPLNHSTSAL